ncbi:MAG: lipid-A-disaccharide synthase, partial [Pseudomonadota bacterium]
HRQFRDLRPVLPMVGARAEAVRALFHDAPGRPVFLDPSEYSRAEKLAAFAASDVAIAASGSVSLELAAAGTPMIVAYQTNWLTALIVRQMVRVETATLVNLVTGKRAVPEYFQGACRPGPIAAEVKRYLLDGDLAEAQAALSAEAMRRLGRGGEDPGRRAARSVLSFLEGAG